MMKVALLAELKAKPGKEDALAALLIESQPIAVRPRSEPPIPRRNSHDQAPQPLSPRLSEHDRYRPGRGGRVSHSRVRHAPKPGVNR